jgi:Collagen triple helix repeat (20 copies)
MFNRIHRKLGTAGFIISIVALVAALGGGAYAASGGLNGKQKKEVEKIAKKYAGKPGAAGPTGPAGSAGAPGAPGTKGDAGATGATGAAGPAGPTGANGKNGTTGFTSTLPSKKTETGVWSLGVVAPAAQAFSFVRSPISFAIPLTAPLDEHHVHFIGEDNMEEVFNGVTEEFEKVVSTSCLGSAETPTAEPGELCIYTGRLSPNVTVNNSFVADPGGPGNGGSSTSGAMINFFIQEQETAPGSGEFERVNAEGFGTWAVTAE